MTGSKPKDTSGDERPGSSAADACIDRPRLTPQGRAAPDGSGEDATARAAPAPSRARATRPKADLPESWRALAH
jgi:hypothetical protein